jgi:hypothetical protein
MHGMRGGNPDLSKPTKEQLLAEIRRLNKENPGVEIKRDFFRNNSQFKDKWTLYFSRFQDFIAAAGLKVPAPPAPTPTPVKSIPVEKQIELDREKVRSKAEAVDKKYQHALMEIEHLQEELDVALCLKEKTPQFFEIQPKAPSGGSEAVAFMVASDWHCEERVLPGDVGEKNEFNLSICESRANKFFQGGHRLWSIMNRDTQIKTIVLAVLGDLISNTLHEDQAESNTLLPADAIYKAQNLLFNGIHFLLKNTDADIVVVCHSGNHGRMTKKQRHTTEAGNSLEQFMYYNLRDLFRGEKRVKFQIATGYHSYMTLWSQYRLRFHHGHSIRYGGGVGGIYIPVNKSINQWNKANNVDLDVFGHFHTYIDAGNFVANGSLIGYNSYAVSIKADFERPQQAFFLVSKKYLAKTMATPIFVSE